MGFWRWLTGRPRERGLLVGDNEFAFNVVGTSFHQTALEGLCGKRTRQGVHYYCAALLTPQPDNPHDHHAVAVTIHGIEVGHLERDVAPDFLAALRRGGFADAASEALVVGGWDCGGHDWGYFGVRLNAFMPFECVTAEVFERRRYAHQG
jgi:hypothetical protein